MSNNAWVDWEGGEMAYSQALQAFACGINPSAEMNPIFIKTTRKLNKRGDSPWQKHRDHNSTKLL